MGEGKRRFGAARLIGLLLLWTFKLTAIFLMIAVPLLGVWISSSLAIFFNEGLAWAIGVGLLMFPVLPLLWELWGSHRRKKKGGTGPRLLNFWDRMVLRTLLINGMFLGGLLYAQPKSAFTALSARGDWMLAAAQGEHAQGARKVLFTVSDHLEWLYKLAVHNPHAVAEDQDKPLPKPKPVAKDEQGSVSGESQPTPKKPKKATNPYQRWPQGKTLHAAVNDMPTSAEQSPKSVGEFFKAKLADPFERARAIHDYVADRIAYDAVALAEKRYPPYDPPTVLRRRKGVCAGYAKLFEAVALAAGLEAVYIRGQARQRDGGVDGEGHAWNGIKLGGRWYLLDVTWDSGSTEGRTFTKELRTTYFLTPPRVFASDHFPDKSAWQLLEPAIKRGDFIRQPMMRPAFYAAGLTLLSPQRSHVTIEGELKISLDNRKGRHVMAFLAVPSDHTQKRARCQVTRSRHTEVICKSPAAGRYAAHLCISKVKYGSYSCVGKIMVNDAR
ncbi:MAG: hypothetical protein JRH20_24915 [Deltaproteobacteria bacterium]|nr:hypothetical protein [Deltaproteobacteria bacterium]